MTSEIEKQFFDTFRIEPQEITDRILLELICINARFFLSQDTWEHYEIFSKSVSDLKKDILKNCIDYTKEYYTEEDKKAYKRFFAQIQQLFKEEE